MTPEIRKPAPRPSAPHPHNGFSLISNDKLLALYSTMLKCRLLKSRLLEQRALAPACGHEAAVVGVAIDLLPQDAIAHAHWAHPSLSAINPSLPVAPDLTAALHIAAANKNNKNSNISVVFSTKISLSSASWLQALNHASLQRLPILFVSQAAFPPPGRKPKVQPGSLKNTGHDFPTVTVDGADVVAVYRVASEAIVHARKGRGPTLIECLRSPSADPLLIMQNYLAQKGLFSPRLKRETTAALRGELAGIVETAPG